MLVRFHSEASAGFTMFGDSAIELLRLMGASGAIPGALSAGDVPEALRRLGQAVASSEGERAPKEPGPEKEQSANARANNDREVPKVKLRTRAYPLLQMLETAIAKECAVVWEDSRKATG